MYVLDTAALLGTDGPDARLGDRYDTIVLYGLGPLLERDPVRLADFIAAARASGVRTIGAPIAGVDRLIALRAFVDAHPRASFDLLVTEHEFWRPMCTDRASCFAEHLWLLDAMRASKLAPRIGAYLGYPDEAEARAIAARVDVVFLNYTVNQLTGAWRYRRHDDRVRWFAAAGVDVWPILYTRGGEASLCPVTPETAERVFLDQVPADLRPRVVGFIYFGHGRGGICP